MKNYKELRKETCPKNYNLFELITLDDKHAGNMHRILMMRLNDLAPAVYLALLMDKSFNCLSTVEQTKIVIELMEE